MNLWDSFAVALRSGPTCCARSSRRSASSSACASVIILVAVGTGASSEVDRQINALGTNMLVVYSGSSRVGGRASGAGTDIPLAEDDMAAIRDKTLGVTAISGQLSGSGPVVRGSANWTTSLSGVHADYTVVRDWQVVSGREITAGDVRSSAKVALVGQTVAKQLFPGEDAVGATIRVKNVPFQVDGVLAAKGQSSFGRDQDDIVLLPMTTARGRIVGKNWCRPIGRPDLCEDRPRGRHQGGAGGDRNADASAAACKPAPRIISVCAISQSS